MGFSIYICVHDHQSQSRRHIILYTLHTYLLFPMVFYFLLLYIVIDEIAAAMLLYSYGEVITEIYERKGDMSKCGSYKGMNLSSILCKVNCKILIEGFQKIKKVLSIRDVM